MSRDDAPPVKTPLPQSAPTALSRIVTSFRGDWIGAGPAGQWARCLVIALGIMLPQFWLYGSSLLGRTSILPLDLLQLGLLTPLRSWSPGDPIPPRPVPHDEMISDLVLTGEPARVRLTESLRRGVFPLTNPYAYCGAPDPFSYKWSPLGWLSVLFPSPVTLAWQQLLIALIAGFGMYQLARATFDVGFLAACFAAWCYPLTAFFILWQGYGLDYSLAFFPWMLYFVRRMVIAPDSLGWLGMIFSSLQGLTTRLDMAGHELIISGLWAAWLLLADSGRFRMASWWRRAAVIATGWGVAFGLSLPYVLPVLDYTSQGQRIQDRLNGIEERPPGSMLALPLLLVPQTNGLTVNGWKYVANMNGNVHESASSGYAGLIAAALLFPLAWGQSRRWSVLCFLTFVMVLSVAWQINLPGFVSLLRFPVINGMSHNRFVFVFGAAVTLASAAAWDDLLRGRVPSIARRIAIASMVLVGVMAVVYFIEPFGARIAKFALPSLRRGTPFDMFENVARYDQSRAQLQMVHVFTLMLSAVGIGAMLLLKIRPRLSSLVASGLFAANMTELVIFAGALRVPCDWKDYYPIEPALKRLAEDQNYRATGWTVFPPRLLEMSGLRDIRGYDGSDPSRLLKLLDTASAETRKAKVDYARTMNFTPRLQVAQPEGTLKLPPALDLLSMRYLIASISTRFEGLNPILVAHQYAIYENPNALPRAFVPRQVVREDDRRCLKMFSDDFFDPASVAFVPTDAAIPDDVATLDEIRGTVKIVEETANRIVMKASMETPGMIVLSDLWDAGWSATVNGSPTPVLRVDVAIRGAVVPAGESLIVMTYWPSTLRTGLLATALSLVVMIVGLVAARLYGGPTSSR